MTRVQQSQRAALPSPDLACTGTVTYDATDPDTHFPPIQKLMPPDGAPNVVVILIDDDHSHLIDPEHRLQVAMLKQ